MPSVAESLLKFRIVQLEGKLAIYEDLIAETEQLASIEKATSGIKAKLEKVMAAWQSHTKKDA